MLDTITNNTAFTATEDVTPYHHAYDSSHMATLVASMQENGWVGAPLVRLDGQLLTGSHRYAAARAAGLTEIPTVEYQDVFCVDSEEIEDAMTEDNWVVILSYLALDSDPEIAAELGMDAH
jgi:hypothetical protein